MSKQQFRKIMKYGIYPIILLCYPLRKIYQVVNLTDLGYNSYDSEMFQQAEATWGVISTYIADLVGFLLEQIPLGSTLVGMNLMTSLIVSATSLVAYFLLIEEIPVYIVFIGEIIAMSLCWCPTIILYNYLTYFLLTLGIFFLYHGVIKDKVFYYILAGIVLGMNVMVRFPNLVEVTLIFSIWYYGCLKRKTSMQIMKETGWYFLGYAIGLIACVIPVITQFGVADIMNVIDSIGKVSGQSSDSQHIATSNAFITFMLYKQNIKWIFAMFILVGVGMLYFRIWKGRYERINQILYMVSVLSLFYWFYTNGLFSVQYEGFDSVLQLGILFLMLSFVMLGWCLLSKKVMKEQKFGASIGILLLFITPFGSDYHIYQMINNLFLIAPIIICMCYLLIRYSDIHFAIQGMLAVFLLVFLVQSILFGQVYVFG